MIKYNYIKNSGKPREDCKRSKQKSQYRRVRKCEDFIYVNNNLKFPPRFQRLSLEPETWDSPTDRAGKKNRVLSI